MECEFRFEEKTASRIFYWYQKYPANQFSGSYRVLNVDENN